MQPWHEVVYPRESVRSGQFSEATFAADLSDVIQRRGPGEYVQAETFFEQTFPTAGLKHLLRNVASRLMGKGGNAVIQLQTAFGGGKTHSLIALYHLAREGNSLRQRIPWLQELLQEAGASEEWPAVRIVAFVGTAEDPLRVTPWGHLARELGQKEDLRKHEEKKISPGKDALHKLIGDSPTLLLYDELTSFITKLPDSEKEQIYSYLQELSETVKVAPRAALVLTFPEEENLGEQGQRVRNRLQQILGRVESVYKPVDSAEVEEIIRRRLFERFSREAEDTAGRVGREFVALYEKFAEFVPQEARQPKYAERIRKAYPFHPLLIDWLQERWASYSTFQRTRGVLRLLALVVRKAWLERKPLPLLSPASVPLEDPSIQSELLKHIDKRYESVIKADISGPNAKALQVDQQLDPSHRSYEVASGLARTIFMGGFSAGLQEKAVTEPYLHLALLRPGLDSDIIKHTLQRLEETLWYLEVRDGRYRFAVQANLNRIRHEEEERVSLSDIEAAIQQGLKELCEGREAKAYIWPSSPSEVPDTTDIKLCILKEPKESIPDLEAHLRLYSEGENQSRRIYRNTLLFLALDGEGWNSLSRNARQLVALERINEAQGGALSSEQKAKVHDLLTKAKSDFPRQILAAYRYLYRFGEGGKLESYELASPEPGWAKRQSLVGAVVEYLRTETHEHFTEGLSPDRLIRFFGEAGGQEKTLKELAEAFARHLHLPMLLKASSVVEQAVRKGVELRKFAVRTEEKVYFGEALPTDLPMSSVIVWKYQEAPLPAVPAEVIEGAEPLPANQGQVGVQPLIVPSPSLMHTPPPAQHRTFRKKLKIDAGRAGDFVRSVVNPLLGRKADVQLEVYIEASGDIDDQTLQNIELSLEQIRAILIQE